MKMTLTIAVIASIITALVAYSIIMPRRARKRFVNARRPMSDTDFINATQTSERDRRYMLAIRHAAGKSCQISPDYILPHELCQFISPDGDVWDPVLFFMHLEEELGVEIPDRVVKRYPLPLPVRRWFRIMKPAPETFLAWAQELLTALRNTEGEWGPTKPSRLPSLAGCKTDSDVVFVRRRMLMRKLTEWMIAIPLTLWIFLIFFHYTMADFMPNYYGRAQIRNLKYQGKEIQGQKLSKPELEMVVSHFSMLRSRVNEYVPLIRYETPVDWTVKLTPKKRRAFARGLWLPYRVLVFDFVRMDFEDIIITAEKNRDEPAR